MSYDMAPDTRTLLPITEAAQRLGVTAQTLRRWEKDGRISAVRTFGNQRRFHVEDIDKLVAGRTPAPAGDAA